MPHCPTLSASNNFTQESEAQVKQKQSGDSLSVYICIQFFCLFLIDSSNPYEQGVCLVRQQDQYTTFSPMKEAGKRTRLSTSIRLAPGWWRSGHWASTERTASSQGTSWAKRRWPLAEPSSRRMCGSFSQGQSSSSSSPSSYRLTVLEYKEIIVGLSSRIQLQKTVLGLSSLAYKTVLGHRFMTQFQNTAKRNSFWTQFQGPVLEYSLKKTVL